MTLSLVHQATSTLLDPSFPIIFICFFHPLFCRVLGMFSLTTLSSLFLIPLPKLTVYQKSFLIYSSRFPPLSFLLSSCFKMRTGLLFSHPSPSSFLPPGLFLPPFRLSTANAFCCMCIDFFLSFSPYPQISRDLAHLHYFAIETIFPPKQCGPDRLMSHALE